jgi:peptidoglycan hydrolase FlgJ
MSNAPVNQSFAFDAQAGSALRARAARDPQGAVKEAAKQFESLFMQEVMKRMRAASLNTGLMENETTKLGSEMLDQQYASAMSGVPGGLSAAIERQLSRGLPPRGADAAPEPAPPLPSLSKRNVPEKAASFIREHTDAAGLVEAESGIPSHFMLAQAAHETGWGRAEIKHRDGSTSHNLFGIKAGPSWKGKVAEITTTEYVDGVARKTTAKFRAYDSYADSFRDYAKLLRGNQRYAHAVAAAESSNANAFAQQLQRAGYATDPAYAEKLARVINTTVRVQRAMA